jgi:hypothetical protein
MGSITHLRFQASEDGQGLDPLVSISPAGCHKLRRWVHAKDAIPGKSEVVSRKCKSASGSVRGSAPRNIHVESVVPKNGEPLPRVQRSMATR